MSLLLVGSTLSNLASLVEVSYATPKMDRELAEMIDQEAVDYFNWDSWGISLSQYKAWIALITLQEASNLRYHAHSSSLGLDKFYHREKGEEFPFCTGIGAFQLDRGGSIYPPLQWGIMPTIQKIGPWMSLISVFRWHQERFRGEKDTLATFSENSAWVAVQPINEPIFASTWEAITGYTWDECKDKYVDFEFNPSKPEFTIEDPFTNTVEYLGKVYLYLQGWDDYFDTWLISAKTYQDLGVYSYSYYYTYREDIGLEEWVWNDPDKKFIYSHERHYTTGPLPENLDGNYCGFTDEAPALDPNKILTGTVELFYDDGSGDSGQSFTWIPDEDYVNMHANLFHYPGESNRLLAVKLYIKDKTENGQDALGYPCVIHVMDINKADIFTLEVVPNQAGWFLVDLEPYLLSVPKDFFIGVERYHKVKRDGDYQYVPVVLSDGDYPTIGESWWVLMNKTSGEQRWKPVDCDHMIRAVISVKKSLLGDIDGDGDVDSADLFTLAPVYGSKSGDARYNPRCDFDNDGDVDSADLFILAPNYGKKV